MNDYKWTAVFIGDQRYTTSQSHENCRKTEAHHANGAKEMKIKIEKFSYLHILEGLHRAYILVLNRAKRIDQTYTAAYESGSRDSHKKNKINNTNERINGVMT